MKEISVSVGISGEEGAWVINPMSFTLKSNDGVSSVFFELKDSENSIEIINPTNVVIYKEFIEKEQK